MTTTILCGWDSRSVRRIGQLSQTLELKGRRIAHAAGRDVSRRAYARTELAYPRTATMLAEPIPKRAVSLAQWRVALNPRRHSGIVQEPGLVLVPALSTRRASCVKVHVYSQDPRGALGRAAELGRRLCEEHDAGKGRLVWFLPPGSDPDPVAACTRIQMRTFGPGDQLPGPAPGVVPLDEITGPARASFSVFAEELAAEGFAFLDARIREHGGTGPVLTCRRDGMIAGAIGPMEIMPDSRGAARLLPQYFGVLPGYRGLGLGRALWRAAMRWGQQHQATYQILQTQTGGASDRLCRSEGLTDLGLHGLQRLAEALRLIEEAVTIRRELAVTSPLRHRPGLASARYSLSSVLYGLDRPAEALQAIEEALAINRELAATNPGQHRPSLAATLIRLGVLLSELNRPADALAAGQEAVTAFRELAAISPDRYRLDLARSLANLAEPMKLLGRQDDAAAALDESAKLCALPPIGQATAHSRWRSGRVQVLHRYPRGASRARRRRPPFVTATGIPRADAAALVRRMTGRYRLPDARRRADTLARTGPPAATMSDRQPDLPTQRRGTRHGRITQESRNLRQSRN